MPLHTRAARVATILAAAAMVTGGTAVATADDRAAQPGPQYFDIEANKARSMRALGIHMATHVPAFDDIEANKAQSQRAR